MIAIALACGPRLLLADEPTTGLDVTVQAQILDLLSDQQRERSMAMVLVTHDLGVVANRTDEIVVMYAGPRGRAGTHARAVRAHPHAVHRGAPPFHPTTHRPEPRRGSSRSRARPPDLAAAPKGCKFAPRCPYAQPRCDQEEPPLRNAGPGHLFRCWYPVGSPEGDEAYASNLRAGLTAAVVFSAGRGSERTLEPAGAVGSQVAPTVPEAGEPCRWSARTSRAAPAGTMPLYDASGGA